MLDRLQLIYRWEQGENPFPNYLGIGQTPASDLSKRNDFALIKESSQKAVVALEVKPHLEREAAERHRQNGGDRKSEVYKSPPQIIAEPIQFHDEPNEPEEPIEPAGVDQPEPEANETPPEPVPPIKFEAPPAPKVVPISPPRPVVRPPAVSAPQSPPVRDFKAEDERKAASQAASMTGTNRQYVRDAENTCALSCFVLQYRTRESNKPCQ